MTKETPKTEEIEEQVVLVDTNDCQFGLMSKSEAHQKTILHRAFSVCIFNQKGDWLLQQRSAEKYHSANLWSNSCCSHPRNGESPIEACKRKTFEELGIIIQPKHLFSFIYKATLGKNLFEYEYDHVFMAIYNTDTIPFNPKEVQNISWVSTSNLLLQIQKKPDLFTAWFKILLKEHLDKISKGCLEYKADLEKTAK